MAKKALLDVLEQTIGKYVKNLDAESLNVAVWSGKIELHALELDVNAVNQELDRKAAEAPNLALPFKVVSGKFESFEVDVPWAALTSRPVVLRAQGLKIDVEPYDRLSQADHLQAVVASEEIRASKIRRAREKSIETSDKYRLQAYAMRKLALADDEPGSENKSTFGSRLVRRIIENIQIEISDVHVSLKDAEGSAGVVLESLSLATTAKDGKRVFVDRTSGTAAIDNSFLYKMLLIDGFGIYLDNNESFQSARSLQPISESGERSEPEDSLHSYVLAPLSFQAKLRQADSNICVDHSKYHLSSELSSLSVILSRNQLDLARRISKEVSSSENVACPLFPEYRPLTRVTKETTRDWWKYAVRCIGRLNGRRSWAEFFLAYKNRKQYIPLYKRQAHHATCSWIKPLRPKEMDELVDIENDRTISVEGLMSWRNLADGQADKEREKHEANQTKGKTSVFSSIFGSREKPTAKETEDDAPPIHLNVNELKELELMSKEEFSDPELSKDSKLCDVKFVLNALKINLTSYDLRHLAALDMGTVSVDFEAAADGAYGFNFDLFDLEIQDHATPNSLFPSVLRSIEKHPVGEKRHNGAFNLNLSKTKAGDQKLKIKLAAFEAIASQILFRELKRFFSDTSIKLATTNSRQNPVLAQSLSGSVDLFYDADQGASGQLETSVPEQRATQSTTATDISNVLVDAWKEKTATKASWVMDVDIKAPVVIIPEKCNDPRASILVFDLGHLRLTYGKINPSKKVLRWFEDHPNEASDLMLDNGSLAVNDLTFKVGKAKEWRRLVESTVAEAGAASEDSAVIEPISVMLEFGIESASSAADTPRICCIGVIPTISLRLSQSQLSNVFPVVGAWSTFLGDLSDESQPGNVESVDLQAESILTTRLHSPTKYQSDMESSTPAETDSIEQPGTGGEHHPKFYFLIGLQQLTVTVKTDSGNKLEAHLVSVYASTSLMSDGSSVSGLRMGWFWILDRMQCPFPRRQRLLAHSNLPRSPASFSEGSKYDILQELTKQGVFEMDYAVSTELADITFKKVGSHVIGIAKRRGEQFVESVLNCSFSSLFVHWNPHAVKGVNAMVNNFTSVAGDYGVRDDPSTLILSPGKSPRSRRASVVEEKKEKVSGGQMLIKAKMESLVVHLNSARDDFPLYVLTVSGAQISILSSQGADMEASLSLGDLRIGTPESMGRTLPAYRTMLGLAPGRTESLLTVKYCQGQGAIDKLDLNSVDTSKLEAYADVELSPMRMSYIQSQAMALMEYITEGILGVLAAQAATSAAQAAIEIANSVAGEKLFIVRATSFDLVIPQAAYKENVIAIHAGSLGVEYYMYPNPGGSKAKVVLSDVSLRDTNGDQMQEGPIRMSVDVILPPDQIGNLDDQAMRVDIDISEASFLLSKAQYGQILHTLDENMGEIELFLRDGGDPIAADAALASENESESSSNEDYPAVGLTHAGVQMVERLRRMYINVNIKVLALQLCGSTLFDPLIRVAALSANVRLQKHPDEETMACQVLLRNLVCEDRRSKASKSQYRFLIDQSSAVPGDDPDGESLFYIGYTSGKNQSSVDLRVGSPQVVLIPEAISELLGFVQVEGRSKEVPTSAHAGDQIVTSQSQVVHVDSSETGEDIEISLVPGTRTEPSMTSVTSISVATKICRIVLVDLGSQVTSTPISVSTPIPVQTTQLTETLVLQGLFSASLSLTSDLQTGKTIEAEFQGQGDAMEIFSAFGAEMKSPLQVLEPSEGSAHGSMKTNSKGETEIEVRAAALTPFEFTFAMHNAALMSAIINSLGESFANGAANQEAVSGGGLSQNETERIEHLASALQAIPRNEAIPFRESISMGDSSVASSNYELEQVNSSRKIKVKLTMPETRITVVNDLQGLDEALFRVSVINFVAGGELNRPSTPNATFDFHMNTSILADYFDASCNLWCKLLTKPWEVTLKGTRASSQRFKSGRLSTTIDLESFPCCISFSEQFLVSLASAYRMWSIYSVATSIPVDEGSAGRLERYGSRKHSMVASAARNLITSLPYAIENHSGVNITFTLPGGSIERCPCSNGLIQYFRFEPPKGNGYGGKRAYGQDVEFEKSVTIFVGDSVVEVDHLDTELGLPRRLHDLKGGLVLLTNVVKEGKTTVLHLASHIGVLNNTSLPFSVAVMSDGARKQVGVCMANNQRKSNSTVLSPSNGVATKESRSFSIPIDLLTSFARDWVDNGESKVSLAISPCLSGHPSEANYPKLSGTIDVTPSLRYLKKSDNGHLISKFDVTCRPEEEAGQIVSPLVVQVLLKMSLIHQNHVYIDVCLEPRAIIENKIPVSVKIRTPMPHTFSSSPGERILGNDVAYDLEPGSRVEVFTPGPSIAVTFKTSDKPCAGPSLDWLDGGWIDLPLVSEFRLPEPIMCHLPFVNENPDQLARSGATGSEFFIAEGFESLAELAMTEDGKPKSISSASAVETLSSRAVDGPLRTFFVTVCFYGIDHTGDILFEQARNKDRYGRSSTADAIASHVKRASIQTMPRPFSAFASKRHRRRITLLPSGKVPLRILQMTMEGDVGFKTSMPFLIEDLAMGEGGVATTPIYWDHKTPTGYYAYRSILNEHQSEVHIVPEFIVFNGSKDILLVKERGKPEIIIEAGKVAQLRVDSREHGLELSLNFIEMDCRSPYVRVDNLGLKVAILNSNAGFPVGSVCIQTVIDTHGDSRLVVKIGEVQTGALNSNAESQQPSFFSEDFFRFRVRWTELQLILNELQHAESSRWGVSKTFASRLLSPRTSTSPKTPVQGRRNFSDANEILQQPVAAIIFSRFTFDFQRVFKESVTKSVRDGLLSPERTQISLIVHNVVIKDLTPDTPFPMVFDCSSNISFLDLCIRIRGPLNADLVKVDLFDLNLAHANGISERMTFTTSEDYVWRILDLANRILAASGDFAGVALKLEEDKEHGGFIVKIEDARKSAQQDELKYTPPKSDTLFDVTLAKVSPFTLLVSFRRNPQASRYQKLHAVKGATLTNYFTRKLKFTIDRAELKFARYEDRSLKGPPDRLLESLAAVYISRMKFKLVTLLSAASLQDWRFLAARDTGDDEFVEGDILRATGNLAGRSANAVFKKVSQGLGNGVSDFSHAVGKGIETTTGKVGAGRVGAGVNSVVSGVGDGVGDALIGVGSGAGKLLKGAGQGIGQVFGGLSGGALQVGKGLGKGIATRDGKAVMDGFAQGASSAGGGIAHGAESAVVGAADGFLTVGKGLFSGVKNVGRGLGGAFTGKKPEKKPKR